MVKGGIVYYCNNQGQVEATLPVPLYFSSFCASVPNTGDKLEIITNTGRI